MYFTLPCSCHIHLELPVREGWMFASRWMFTAIPCQRPCAGWHRLTLPVWPGRVREKFLFIWLHGPMSEQGRKAPFTCSDTALLQQVRRVKSFNVLLVQRQKCVCWTHRSSSPCHLKEPKQNSGPVPACWTHMMRRTAKFGPGLFQDAWSFCLTSGFH